MAAPRKEWLQLIVEVLGASRGISMRTTTIPFNAARLEAMASSGLEIQ